MNSSKNTKHFDFKHSKILILTKPSLVQVAAFFISRTAVQAHPTEVNKRKTFSSWTANTMLSRKIVVRLSYLPLLQVLSSDRW